MPPILLPLAGGSEEGKFRWPSVQDAVMRLSAAELSARCWKGLIGSRVHAAREVQARCSRDDCGTVNQRAGKAGVLGCAVSTGSTKRASITGRQVRPARGLRGETPKRTGEREHH